MFPLVSYDFSIFDVLPVRLISEFGGGPVYLKAFLSFDFDNFLKLQVLS
jgi:hypothetical protein